jgi:hypothetical protein
MKSAKLLILFLLASIGLRASSADPSHFFSIAPVLQINGYGLNMKWGHFNSTQRFSFYTFDIDRLKHQKEIRQPANMPYNGFVFGRTHIAIPISIGMGQFKTLGVRNNKNDVGVGWTYQYGLTLALLKPVYLFVDPTPNNQTNDDIELIRYEEESTFDYNSILGGASFFTGINQIKSIPGAFGKTSLVFNWGRYYNDLHSVELGVMVHGYIKRLPLMAKVKNNFVYPVFYLAVNLGKYW